MSMFTVAKWSVLLAGVSTLAIAQSEKEEVPLMRPDERKTVDAQSATFNKALEPILTDAAKSTVVVWGKDREVRALAYGTVIGDGSQILSKWSEIEPFSDLLYVTSGAGVEAKVEVAGVFTDEDLVLLEVKAPGQVKDKLVPAVFDTTAPLPLGRFLTAPQPSGKPAAFGVVAVLERNLRETDQAHLGIIADPEFRGEGVRIANVQPEYGAAEAGLQSGDVIMKVDDRAISGLQELKNALTNKHPGGKVKILLESAGKERSTDVKLSNRPLLGQFSGGQLNQMEIMGGDVNRIRAGFSRVVQSDMQIRSNRIGGPVADLQGKIVGVTMARADRTRTYIMGSSAVLDVLKSKYDTVAEARQKGEVMREQLAKQEREMMQPMFPQGQRKPQTLERMKRHLSDLDRLARRAMDELEALENP